MPPCEGCGRVQTHRYTVNEEGEVVSLAGAPPDAPIYTAASAEDVRTALKGKKPGHPVHEITGLFVYGACQEH